MGKNLIHTKLAQLLIPQVLLYDENSWNQKKKVDLLFVFVCWIFL